MKIRKVDRRNGVMNQYFRCVLTFESVDGIYDYRPFDETVQICEKLWGPSCVKYSWLRRMFNQPNHNNVFFSRTWCTFRKNRRQEKIFIATEEDLTLLLLKLKK